MDKILTPSEMDIQAPCVEWRTILALCRNGGLRCPSELLRLKWNDIDFPNGRMTIRAPKTEHHKNAGIRNCPRAVVLLC